MGIFSLFGKSEGTENKREEKLAKQKKNLVKYELMEESDTLVDFFQANYVEHLLAGFGQWQQGWAYFTEERLIVITGLLEDHIVIPYRNIRSMEKGSQGAFPIAVSITYENLKGELATDKISLMKRDEWMEFMAQRADLPLEEI